MKRSHVTSRRAKTKTPRQARALAQARRRYYVNLDRDRSSTQRDE